MNIFKYILLEWRRYSGMTQSQEIVRKIPFTTVKTKTKRALKFKIK